jgi:uncharacterized protein YfaS (alpha-2-macroglobulin family)
MRLTPTFVLKAFFAAAFAYLGTANSLAADTIVPERRIVVVEDMDFLGGDIGSIFDTSFDACQSACLSDRACQAFTYNTQASACFLKSGFDDMQVFPGAISARIVELPPAALALVEQRAADLDFLPDGFLNEAQTLATDLGARFPTNSYGEADLISAARRAARSGEIETAANLRSAALNLNDTVDGWIELSRIYLKVKNQKRKARRNAVAAAINGYLRAQTTVAQALALNQLAMALEARGHGRAMIPALRLSMSVAPWEETEEALIRAASLYGFRIVEHTVDSDVAAPRICVTLSEPLAQAGVDYATYIRIEGADLPIETEGRQICIDGVSHGQRYRFTVRAGLPAASGETMLRSADLDVYVRDRAPSVRFLGRAYVLPKSGAAAIPIVSVNLDEVDLNIHRVGDRNLLAVIQDGLFDSPLSSYTEDRIGDRLGTPVWSGIGEVERRLNADVTTAIPIGDAVATFEPGAYVMTARVAGDGERWESVATQWFVVTDLGLTSMTGEDGLHVFIRTLSGAEAAPGMRLRLIATNNEVLGETVSDADGYARFAPGLTRGAGGSAPALLTAEADDGDFAFLNLSRAGLDLSDRGVEGRAPPAPVDVFLATERGAYRPGETVHATILARDARADAVENLPLTAIVIRPDGVELSRALLGDQGAGGRVFDVALDPAAQRGTWRLTVHADAKALPLADVAFLVEDFIPERIDFDVTAPDGAINLTDIPVVSVAAPRFLAPGDRSRVQIDLTHVTGSAGEVTVALTADAGLTVGIGGARQIMLAPSERKTLLVPVSASAVGDPALHLAVTTPDGARLEKTLRLSVRANDPEIARQNRIPLAADGGRLIIDANTFTGLVPGTGRATLGVGPIARFDVPGLLTALDRYPYGCTEQLTSRALPLLYFDQVAEAMGLNARRDVAGRVAQAISKILANQSGSGAFGLWRPGRGDLWLDAYVTDFLGRARLAGHSVPDIAFTAALDNLRNQIAYAGDFEQGGEDIAYALMVLAREGMASIGDLRYYADARGEALSTPLAKAQLGAALASYGEQQRADAMFRLAALQVAAAKRDNDLHWRADYGSNLRDVAGVLALAVEARSQVVDPAALSRRILARSARRSSTQEKVWTLLAAQALIEGTQANALTVDGVASEGPVIRLFEAGAIGDDGSVLIENRGGQSVDAVLTTFGVPIEPEPAGGNGYTIERAYFTLEGEPVSPQAVPQNARLVTVLTITDHGPNRARLIVDDPLPAGFEIDNPNLLRAGDLAALDWLDLTENIAHVEFRSDRFVAAVDGGMNGNDDQRFELAYIVRAVSPGRFHHPAASVEDMYRPAFRARTATGTVEVLGATR